MSENKGKVDNPFASFSLLEGKIPVPSDDESDIETGDTALIDDESIDEEAEKLTASKALADAKLEEVARIQAKKNKKKEEVIDDVVDTEDVTDDLIDDEPVDNGYKTAIKHLSDKGIFDISDKDLEELEDSEEALEIAADKTLETRFEKLLKNKLGDEGLALLSFINDGGNPKEFISTYYNDASWQDYSVDSETSQKVALREALRHKDEAPEDIEDLIQEYADNGTLEKRAKSALNYLQRVEATQKHELLENQKKAAEVAKNTEKQRFDDFKADILKREDIKGFKLTPKLKEKLIDFTTAIDKKSGKTGYQQAAENDKDAFLLFALQAMNGFDISKLEKQVMTKVSSKLGGILKNYKTPSRERLASGRTDTDNPGENPFEGFKRVA